MLSTFSRTRSSAMCSDEVPGSEVPPQRNRRWSADLTFKEVFFVPFALLLLVGVILTLFC
jgi:hypothetical protein